MTGDINLLELDFDLRTPANRAAERAFNRLDEYLSEATGFLSGRSFSTADDQENFSVTSRVVFGQSALNALKEGYASDPKSLYDVIYTHKKDQRGGEGSKRFTANALRTTPGALVTGRDTLVLTEADWKQFVLLSEGDDTATSLPFKVLPAGGAALRTNGAEGDDLVAALVGVNGFSPEWNQLHACFFSGGLLRWIEDE